MRLLAELPGRWWILAALLVTTWLLLWRRPVHRRVRMWFAGLAPLVCAAVLAVGVTIISRDDGPAPGSCVDAGPCGEGGSAHWAHSLAAISDTGLAVTANALLAGVVALPLLVVTAIVELFRTAAARSARATGPGGRGRREGSPGTRRSTLQ
ncbi:hypothetical protein [Micromonospora auratinigra]|uniref:Uncharacterized protein n=1 Tax=Micromonospora auratinigra TaxID=261654 RepID=A0A1A9AAL5_9ACTN|nr:hypothetical protein [Micromonospora auratinigra]SBT53143.1 hypothetical protein GA0070611_5974 [Micromonospora auratinigra]